MINTTKHSFREKILKCVQEGTNELSQKIDSLSERADNLEQHISEASNDAIQKINNLTHSIDTINSHPIEKNYVSSEYVLDSLHALRINKPRILICGYYGARNLGDELMLQSILKRLNHKKFDITIMLAPYQENDTSIYAPYNVIHYPARNNDILILAKNYDYIIWGGGAVLDDSDYYFNYLNNTLGYILLKTSLAALQSNKKVYILGVSTNQSLQDRTFISDLQRVIDKANYFSLRDTNSLKTLEDSQIDTKRIKIIDDIVIPDIPISLPKKQTKNLNIGLVFIFDDKNSKKIISFIKLMFAYFSDKPVNLSFIPFYDHNNYDQEHIRTIISSIDFPKNIHADIKPFFNNLEELIQFFSQCDCIFSMRYHATLISNLCGIKTLSIDYSKEHRHYYNKLSYIKQHYNNFEKILFADISDKKAVFNAIERTLAQVPRKANPSIIKLADRTLSEILAQL